MRLKELPKGISNLVNLRHLNLRDNFLDIRMPPGIGRLTNLQTLPTFNVGRHDGVSELRDLVELRELCISGVCNLVSVDDVKIANLKNKKHLGKLTLMWSPRDEQWDDDHVGDQNLQQAISLFSKEQFFIQDRNSVDIEDGELYGQLDGHEFISDSENTSDVMDMDVENVSLTNEQEDNGSCFMSRKKDEVMIIQDPILVDVEKSDEIVLEGLRPSTHLTVLEIRSFGGFTFPSWMGDPDFYKLKFLVLDDCRNCKYLPPLGELPHLEYLSISCMPLEHVGYEFCVKGCKSFPSLKTLSFHNMYNWVKWNGFEKDDFPSLSHLTIFNCPKLQEVPNLLSLMSLEVERCDELNLIPAIPSLQSLTLRACDVLTSLPRLPSLCDLTVTYCRQIRCLPYLPLLENLWIEDCEQLISIDFWSTGSSTAGLLSNITRLKSLLVANCHQLRFSSEETLPPTIQYSNVNGCLTLT